MGNGFQQLSQSKSPSKNIENEKKILKMNLNPNSSKDQLIINHQNKLSMNFKFKQDLLKGIKHLGILPSHTHKRNQNRNNFIQNNNMISSLKITNSPNLSFNKSLQMTKPNDLTNSSIKENTLKLSIKTKKNLYISSLEKSSYSLTKDLNKSSKKTNNFIKNIDLGITIKDLSFNSMKKDTSLSPSNKSFGEKCLSSVKKKENKTMKIEERRKNLQKNILMRALKSSHNSMSIEKKNN